MVNQKERDYWCDEKGNCSLAWDLRNECRYCRYQKCLAHGMLVAAARNKPLRRTAAGVQQPSSTASAATGLTKPKTPSAGSHRPVPPAANAAKKVAKTTTKTAPTSATPASSSAASLSPAREPHRQPLDDSPDCVIVSCATSGSPPSMTTSSDSPASSVMLSRGGGRAPPVQQPDNRHHLVVLKQKVSRAPKCKVCDVETNGKVGYHYGCTCACDG